MILPKVTIIIPQLGREAGLMKCLESILALNYPQDKIQIVIIDGEGTVPFKVSQGLKQSTGEYIAFGANDIEFEKDSLLFAVEDSINQDKALVAFDTGVRNDKGFICEHFLIRKNFIEKIGGEIFDLQVFHVGVDDLLWHKCYSLGQAVISRGQVVHHHFSRLSQNIQMDEVNKKGWLQADDDRELVEKKKKEWDLKLFLNTK